MDEDFVICSPNAFPNLYNPLKEIYNFNQRYKGQTKNIIGFKIIPIVFDNIEDLPDANQFTRRSK